MTFLDGAPDGPAPTRGILALGDLAARVLSAPPRLGTTRLVCIEGPACSGKSSLAGRLAEALGDAPVVHMDDLYEGWTGLRTVWQRLDAWILTPVGSGRPGRYRRYDWVRGSYAEWHDVPVSPVLVVEGVGSAPQSVDAVAGLRIWVDAPEATRRARAAERDHGGFDPYWDAWANDERRHFAQERTRDRADLEVDGAPSVAYDRAREVVVTTRPAG